MVFSGYYGLPRNKIDHYEITELFQKVAFNPNPNVYVIVNKQSNQNGYESHMIKVRISNTVCIGYSVLIGRLIEL